MRFADMILGQEGDVRRRLGDRADQDAERGGEAGDIAPARVPGRGRRAQAEVEGQARRANRAAKLQDQSFVAGAEKLTPRAVDADAPLGRRASRR